MAGNLVSYLLNNWCVDRLWIAIETWKISYKLLFSFLRYGTSKNHYFWIFIMIHRSRVFSNPVTVILWIVKFAIWTIEGSFESRNFDFLLSLGLDIGVIYLVYNHNNRQLKLWSFYISRSLKFCPLNICIFYRNSCHA